jgi:dGTP triphosphohydrolase
MLPEHVQNFIGTYLKDNKQIPKDVLITLINDYISGMTDRYAIHLWEKLKSPTVLKLAI